MIGIILAGGNASRLGGGDKGMRHVGGRPIIERVVSTMRPQCDALVLSANGDPGRFASLVLDMVADELPDRPGPLAGLLSALDHVATHHPDAAFAVTVPADAPFLPSDLVARLADTRIAERAAIVCARSGEHTHHTVALWSVALRDDLRRTLVDEGSRKVSAFVGRHAFSLVSWPTTPRDPFFNVNTPEDLASAERIAARV